MRELIKNARAHVEARDVISGTIAGSVVGVLTALASQSLWVIALSSVAAFALMPWGFIGWRTLEDLRYRAADFEKWDRVDLPALWQAACLYDDIEPYPLLRDGTPSYASLQMLKSEIMAGTLKVAGEYGVGGDTWPRVRRADLRRIAERRGDRPKSLFPEDR